MPASFLHVAHVGFNSKGVIEASKDIDPAWTALLQGSGDVGVVHEVIISNIHLTEGILTESPVRQPQAIEGAEAEPAAVHTEASADPVIESVATHSVAREQTATPTDEAIVAASPTPVAETNQRK